MGASLVDSYEPRFNFLPPADREVLTPRYILSVMRLAIDVHSKTDMIEHQMTGLNVEPRRSARRQLY
jgi:hypothetical protein